MISLASVERARHRIGRIYRQNAGGTGVLRHGPARTCALGLEAVLPDGRAGMVSRALGRTTQATTLNTFHWCGEWNARHYGSLP